MPKLVKITHYKLHDPSNRADENVQTSILILGTGHCEPRTLRSHKICTKVS